MVYKFVILSDEVDDFRREIEIDAEATFTDLNNILLKTCEYKKDLMTAFYICDEYWDKKQEVTAMDLKDESQKDEQSYLMDKTHLSDLVPLEEAQKKAKILFLFDTMCDRYLYMQVREVIERKHLLTPEVVVNKGKAPKQEGNIDDMFGGLSEDSGAMYGDEDYDPDELDLEGYQDLEDIESGGY
ncbi:MAG: hypothetical protein IJP70_07920 [Bacteroidales bacterium]|nr:hypothetical protein [Bacteroidales bacterium]